NCTATLTGGVFSILSSPAFDIPGHAQTNVVIGFAPSNAGTYSNAVLFASANGGSSTNPITGIGLTPGQFSVSPPSLSFGTIAVGSNAQASFVLTNSGGTPITNGTASINDGGFTIISGTPFNLGGFGSTNLVIRFTPTNASLFSNAVVFTTP